MIRKSYFSAIVAVLALVACSKDFQEPCPVGPISSDNVHTLSVGIEAGTYTPAEGGTKASMEAVIRVNWTANDEVSVVNATTKKILGGCLKAKESGVSVTFEGTVTGTIDNGDRLYYIYPKLNNTGETAFADAGYDVSLAGQTYDGDNPDKVSFFGYAEDVAGSATISKKIQFKLVTSYAHLNMANLPAKGFNLSSIDISKVNKGFKWSLSDSKELTVDAYGENEGISVNCSNCKITQAGNAVVRFAIPASAATGSEPRVVTVNKAYTNDKYVKDQLIPSAYYNQLYTTWENNVKVTSQGDKTKVDITTSEGSTDVAEGVIPVAEAFNDTKPTEIGIGGVGTVTFDATATAKIKSNADAESSTNVFFKVEDVTEDADVQKKNIVYEVTMKTVDEQGVEVFSEDKAAGAATVQVPLGDNVLSVQSVKLLNAEGQPIEGGVVEGSLQFDESSRILTFKVVHFSKYAIEYTERVQPINAVAKIGERNYETLSSAVAAAQNGNTIKLLRDCMDAEGIIVPGGKNFTLDFGGHTYKVTKDLAGSTGTKNQCFQLLKGSTLVFQNGKITTSCAKLGINSYSDLVVKDVTVDMSQTSATGQVACFETCNGTTSLQGNTSLIAKEGQIAVLALYWPNSYGDINVELNTTGEVKGLMAYGSYQVQDKSTVAQHSHVAIKNGKYDVTFDMDGLENYDFKIYGGVFKTSPDTKCLAPNHEVVMNTDPETSGTYPYKVQQKPPVVKIGGVEYATLADAFAAVPTDATPTTVTLLENIGSKNGDEIVWKEYNQVYVYTINKGQNVTFDLNGHKIYAKTTVNGETCFFRVENGGTLTIQDSSEGGELNYLDGNDNTGGFGICSAGNLTIKSGTIENHTECKNSAIQGAIDVHANEWGTPYASHVTFKMDGGVLKSHNDNTLRIYDSSQTGKGTVVFDFEISGGEIYGADAVFIMTQWTKDYCCGTDTYMNNINASVTGGKFVTKNGIRVVGNVGDDNNKNYMAIKINVSGGDFTILSSKESKHRVNNVAFQESVGWTSTEESTQHLRSYTEVTWTASAPTYSTPTQ